MKTKPRSKKPKGMKASKLVYRMRHHGISFERISKILGMNMVQIKWLYGVACGHILENALNK